METLRTHEEQPDIKRFLTEQKEALEKEGYKIFTLSGESVKSLKHKGRGFYEGLSRYSLESKTSIHSEVAINPYRFFLPNSSNKTLEEQEKMIAELTSIIGTKVSGVEAIIGEVPDYAELAFAHQDRWWEQLSEEGQKDRLLNIVFDAPNGELINLRKYTNYDSAARLFVGEEFRFTRGARTKTPVGVSSNTYSVQDYPSNGALIINNWPVNARISDLWVAPLIVPSGNKR